MKYKRKPSESLYIREEATLSSKGQVTLPKSIRQSLRLETGSKLSFELHQDHVVLKAQEESHEDPAIGAYLNLLEKDITQGQHIQNFPEGYRASLREGFSQDAFSEEVSLDDEIEGDVSL